MTNKCRNIPTGRIFTVIFSGLCIWSLAIAINGGSKTAIASLQKNFINVDATLQPITSSLIIEQGKTVSAITSPLFITSQTLASLFDTEISNSQKDIIKHTVAKGENLSSIANKYNITVATILLANELDSSTIHEGQELLILPVDGIIHMVEKGETLAGIAKEYSANKEEIIDYNGLPEEGDIYVGDVLIVPNGKAPMQAPVTAPSQQYAQITLPNSYFIVPTIGTLTQRAHYSETSSGAVYYNAVDIANSIGTPVVAAAGGTVQIVKNRWPYGNYITILHPNGVVTLYAHLSFFARNIVAGATVSQGQIIGFMGNTGRVATLKGGTGAHLHFETRGASNPLTKFAIGSKISY